jgi:hypothetical protein
MHGTLTNLRHERFAQALALGKAANEAYAQAGYRANDGNASRLKGNERISARVQEIEAELGLALMYPSMIPIYGGCSTGARVRLHSPSSLRGRDPRVVVVFGVAILECDLIFSAGGDGGRRSPELPRNAPHVAKAVAE